MRECSDYFLSNGLDPIRTTMAKKFSKLIHDLVTQYYREKKENIKRKKNRLLPGQTQHVRYLMKMALFSIITSCAYDKTIKRLIEAY